MDSKKILTRRNTLKLFLPAVVSIGTAISLDSINKQESILALDNPNRNFRLRGNKSLNERAAAKGLVYGSSVRYKDFNSSPKYAKVVALECGILVPEWELKWTCGDTTLRPNSRDFDFRHADWIIDFARNKKILIRGHTLVWHESLPKWFEEQANPQNAEMLLTNHIQTVVGHYAGKIHSWDVVNEALWPSDGRSDGLRKTPWLNLLGQDYIDLAFRLAHQADPKALLTYNEFGLDYDTTEDEAKRQAVLNLLKKLKSKGTPIHALGIQAHLSGDRSNFNQHKFRIFLKDVASLGLKIMITELDVNDQKLPLDVNKRDQIIAGAYEDYLSAALEEKAVIGVITWGLDDPHSWLSESFPRKDRAVVRTLPLDRNFNRKLAWNAIARAFDRAPKR
jgi:endo-1,4-beta-xylanase